jgi:hypothetical protein
LQATFSDRSSIYVGGLTPKKFVLIVNAPNNPPYFIKSPQAYLTIDLEV